MASSLGITGAPRAEHNIGMSLQTTKVSKAFAEFFWLLIYIFNWQMSVVLYVQGVQAIYMSRMNVNCINLALEYPYNVLGLQEHAE